MKIAVIGSGIAGLSTAWLLARDTASRHEVVLFEKDARLGGHTNTIDVTLDGITHPVDTGFLVYNDWTYPNLIGLFKALNIDTAASDMSFSVKLMDATRRGRLEWCGSDDLTTAFAQPTNLLRPRFLGMLLDLMRFNREALALARRNDEAAMPGTLGDYLAAKGYGAALRDWYLTPMAACIWSTPLDKVAHFPLAKFLTFCRDHGLLSVNDRPKWRTVKNGAREYVRAITASLPDVRCAQAVTAVKRTAGGLSLTANGRVEPFDQVVLACHSNQARALLDDTFAAQKSALGAIAFQDNVAVVHTDSCLLPDRARAWGAWNFLGWHESVPQPLRERAAGAPVSLSYLINKLQPVPFKRPVIVTMNPLFAPEPSSVLARIPYAHPLFLKHSTDAQRAIRTVQGRDGLWIAGAWTRYGFHEDGVMSGVSIAKALGADIPWASNTPAANDLTTPYPGVDA
jgi:predicted NAD/FAD-binding protein